MKYLIWVLAGVAVLVVGFIGAEKLASERVEVVELHTSDAEGMAVTTRLWIVDDAGYQYLRVGADGSGWFTRLQENGQFQLSRNNISSSYRAVLRPAKSALINDKMQAKYTWGDSLIALLVGSRDGSIPIELHPLDP